MSLIYFLIGTCVMALAAGAWGYWDYHRQERAEL
jgi:hypothetical protein